MHNSTAIYIDVIVGIIFMIYGIKAIAQKKMILKWGYRVKGKGAVFYGVMIAILGFLALISALQSLHLL